MSPERRQLVLMALGEILELFLADTIEQDPEHPLKLLDLLSDAELTVMVSNIEALLERAQQTDV